MQELSAFNKFMISYDVCNLFTNIPLKETIKLAVNLIFEKRPETRVTRKQLTKLFAFATSGTHFLFNGNYHDQIDGVAMGSLLGPVLTNLFMGYHEKVWLEEFKTCEVVSYRRYVNDSSVCLLVKKMRIKFFTFFKLSSY